MKFGVDQCEVMHVRRKTLSFLYKMTKYEVTINDIKVRLQVMTGRSVKKCTQYLTEQPTNRNKKPPNQNQQITSGNSQENYLG